MNETGRLIILSDRWITTCGVPARYASPVQNTCQSLQLSGVFEAAQTAADRYLEEARKRADKIEEAARQKAAQMIADAEEAIRNRSENT